MKHTLRQKYKQLRADLTQQQVEDKSMKIAEQLIEHFTLTHKNISIFLPIKKFNEVNTWHLIKKVQANFYLPVVTQHHLKHIKYENQSQLKCSSWGIEEPTYGEEISAHKFDVVIVPLLAYDVKGNRVGYGAGFYDGFLKDCHPNCKFIGVSFFNPESNVFETYPTDIPLHYCVTPSKVITFN